uniref:hypothetical protein n=1 Tax=Amycolatopsis benzoatilytica TaxID=346045 RepID=UPI0037C7A700
MTDTTTDQALSAALRTLFPADVAEEIEQGEAFGALAYRVRERATEYGQAPADVLGAIEAGDREYAGRAENPAAFLAAKVRDLPEPQPQAVDTAETSTNAPAEVVQIIDAVRAFTDAVERVGAEEFAAAARELGRAEFAWTVDRLDDVRQSLGSVFEQLAGAAEEHGAEPGNWDEIGTDLERAGDGAYKALGEIDPAADRHSIVGSL